jgi:hypothetical protein
LVKFWPFLQENGNKNKKIARKHPQNNTHSLSAHIHQHKNELFGEASRQENELKVKLLFGHF